MSDEPSRFTMAHLLFRTDSVIWLYCLDTKGSFDGLRLLDLNSVERVKAATAYIRERCTAQTDMVAERKLVETLSSFDSLFRFLRDGQEVCTLVFENDVHSGIIIDYDDDWLKIKFFNEESLRFDGESLLNRSDLVYVWIRSIFEERVSSFVLE